jgi:hypothetical protein
LLIHVPAGARACWQAGTAMARAAGVGVCVAAALSACATRPTSTATYIERGDATLLPQSVTVDPDGLGIISALVSVDGVHKRISILASDCDDGIGHIATLENDRRVPNRRVFAYVTGTTPADRLFASVCAVRRQLLKGAASGAPAGAAPP